MVDGRGTAAQRGHGNPGVRGDSHLRSSPARLGAWRSGQNGREGTTCYDGATAGGAHGAGGAGSSGALLEPCRGRPILGTRSPTLLSPRAPQTWGREAHLHGRLTGPLTWALRSWGCKGNERQPGCLGVPLPPPQTLPEPLMGSGPTWQAAQCGSGWLPRSQAPRPHAGVPAAHPHEPDPRRAWQAKAWIPGLKHGGDTT